MKSNEECTLADSFAAQGYCQVTPRSPEFSEAVDRAAECFTQLMLDHVGGPFVHAFHGESGVPRQLRFVHYRSTAYRDLMQSAEISVIVKQIFGMRRMYVTHSKISHKQVGLELDWYPHQDNGYKLLHQLPVSMGITIAVFLEDADDRNGTIQVFPGSHRLKTLPHVLHPNDRGDPRQLVVQTLPDIEPRSIVAKKGDILAFDFDLIHKSAPNQWRGYRPVFLFEIKPHSGLPLNELGHPPVIINGNLTAAERFRYFFSSVWRRANMGSSIGRVRAGSDGN